ncbi:hypothetical protein K504DRAFT_458975 [Pleomassaria siparia CBS 279.74]|uniref:Uncharacterized protein n=1 Tax=Pleomassaria siparia CBS 279.74 TaxID=1314801 RepID=A0A6G1K2A4_9PLEO|nr:hypothetical protein K504DRAFT_458975 [Pleomassaria siparia CBS 279.74]
MCALHTVQGGRFLPGRGDRCVINEWAFMTGMMIMLGFATLELELHTFVHTKWLFMYGEES